MPNKDKRDTFKKELDTYKGTKTADIFITQAVDKLVTALDQDTKSDDFLAKQGLAAQAGLEAFFKGATNQLQGVSENQDLKAVSDKIAVAMETLRVCRMKMGSSFEPDAAFAKLLTAAQNQEGILNGKAEKSFNTYYEKIAKETKDIPYTQEPCTGTCKCTTSEQKKFSVYDQMIKSPQDSDNKEQAKTNLKEMKDFKELQCRSEAPNPYSNRM